MDNWDHAKSTGNCVPMEFTSDGGTNITFGEGMFVTVYPDKRIEYKFNEDVYLKEAQAHIDGTYTAHYSGKYQATDMIIDAGFGTGFNMGNIIKYSKRYGKKEGYNRKDLLKIIHYATMQLHVHDTENLGEEKN